MRKNIKGEWGEDIAHTYLKRNHYHILKKNFRSSGSEVDIIAKKDQTLCFIEVKTRKSWDHGQPEEFVDEKKMKRIIRAAKIFTADKRYADQPVRFDIISIIYSGKNYKIDHLINAFENDFD